jgi:hypothetical protein
VRNRAATVAGSVSSDTFPAIRAASWADMYSLQKCVSRGSMVSRYFSGMLARSVALACSSAAAYSGESGAAPAAEAAASVFSSVDRRGEVLPTTTSRPRAAFAVGDNDDVADVVLEREEDAAGTQACVEAALTKTTVEKKLTPEYLMIVWLLAATYNRMFCSRPKIRSVTI